jgi:hypothetical protein
MPATSASYRPHVGVHLILTDGEKVLLLRRANTGFADPDNQSRIGVFFSATRWTGEPVNAEPGKCGEIGRHHLSDLPADIVTYIRTGLEAHAGGTAFSLDGW